MVTTNEQTAICKRCAEVIYFVLEDGLVNDLQRRTCGVVAKNPCHCAPGSGLGPCLPCIARRLLRERFVARNIIDGDVHPCVNP